MDLARRAVGTDDDAFEVAANLRFEGFRHRVARLTYGYNQDPAVAREVVQIITDAKDSVVTLNAPRKRFWDAGLREGTLEDVASCVTHTAELSLAISREAGHGRDYIGSGEAIRTATAAQKTQRSFWLRDYLATDPGLDRVAHLAQAAFEEVIRGLDEDELLGVGQPGYERFQFCSWTELVAGPGNEELWLAARLQKMEIVIAVVDRRNWCTQSDECSDAIVRTRRSQANGSAKGKAGKNQGEAVLAFEPFQSCADVVELAIAMIMAAFAESRASKVEAQYRKTKSVQCLHRVKHNLIVERAAKERVWMTDESRVGCAGQARVQQRFKSADRPLEKKRADG